MNVCSAAAAAADAFIERIGLHCVRCGRSECFARYVFSLGYHRPPLWIAMPTAHDIFHPIQSVKTVCDKHMRCATHSTRDKKDVEIGLACVLFCRYTHATLLLLLFIRRLSHRCTVMETKNTNCAFVAGIDRYQMV